MQRGYLSIFLYTIDGGKRQYECPPPVFLADARTIYFAAGAAVTYIISILRMATIFTIGMNGGRRANVPLLLRSAILNRMDRVVSTAGSRKPNATAENHQ